MTRIGEIGNRRQGENRDIDDAVPAGPLRERGRKEHRRQRPETLPDQKSRHPGRFDRCQNMSRIVRPVGPQADDLTLEGAGRAPSATSFRRPMISHRANRISQLRKVATCASPALVRTFAAGFAVRPVTASVAIEGLRDFPFQLVERGKGKQLRPARADKGNVDDLADAARPALHDDDPVGKENGFVDAVGHEQRCRPAFHPDALQLDVHLAGAGSGRARRRAHPETGPAVSSPATGRSRRAGACRPESSPGRAFSNPERPTRVDELRDLFLKGHPVAVQDVERQHDVVFDRAPGHQGGILKGDPGHAAPGRLERLHAADPDIALVGRVEAEGDPEHGGLAAGPKARSGP